MPETIRTANERLRSRPWRGGFLVAFVTPIRRIVPTAMARAEMRLGSTGVDAVRHAVAALRTQEITALTLILALIGFAFLATLVVLRTRRTADRLETDSRDEIGSLQAEIYRFKALLLSEPQVLVTWAAAAEQPEILGDTAMVAPAGVPERALAFGTWLAPAAAHRMEEAVDTLRRGGRGFVIWVTSRNRGPSGGEG